MSAQPAALHTDLNEDDRHLLAALLRQGRGVDDAVVQYGMDPKQVRACVAYWRGAGLLRRILDVSVQDNARALRVMGIGAAVCKARTPG